MIGYTVDLHVPVFLGLYLVMLGMFYLIRRFIQRGPNSRFIYVAAFIFYNLAIVKLAILPITILFQGHQVHHPELYIQLVPFKTIKAAYEYGNYIQVIGNIILLLPLPLFLNLVFKPHFSFLRTLIISGAFCIGIEVIQYIIDISTQYPNKVMDIDDVILNTIGIIIGCYLAKHIKNSSAPAIKKVKSVLGLV